MKGGWTRQSYDCVFVWKKKGKTNLLQTGIHHVALTYEKTSQDLWITEQEWMRKKTTLKFYSSQEK